MDKKNKSLSCLGYQKTLVEMSRYLVAANDCQNAGDAEFCKDYKLMGKICPALENLAAELNLNHNANIRFSDETGEGIPGQAKSFYLLSDELHRFMRRNPDFQKTETLFDLTGDFSDEKMAAVLRDAKTSAEADNKMYWLSKTLEISEALAEKLREEREERMFNDIEESNLSEKMASVLQNSGVMTNDETAEEIRDVLLNAGERFSISYQKLNKQQMLQVLVSDIKKTCLRDSDEGLLLKAMTKNIDSFMDIVKDAQKDIKGIKGRLIAFRSGIVDLDKPEDDGLFRIRMYKDKVRADKMFRLPEEEGAGSWDKQKKLPDYLEPYREDERFSALLSKKDFWENYESKSTLTESSFIRKNFNNAVRSWVELLRERLPGQRIMLAYMKGDADNGEEEGGFVPQSAEAKVKGKISVINYAHQLVAASEAADKYMNVVLNSSGIGYQTLERFNYEGDITLRDAAVLDILFNSFEAHYEGVPYLFQQQEEVDSKDFEAEICALPHSPEKREMLNFLVRSYEDISDDAFENQECVQQIAYEAAARMHRGLRFEMGDFLESGAAVFDDLNEDDIDRMAEGIDEGVTVNYVVPMYAGEKPFDNAMDFVLMQVPGYSELSEQTGKFISSLVKDYVKKTTAFHENLIETKSFDRSMPDYAKDYYEALDGYGKVEKKLSLCGDELEAENKIYKQYKKFVQEKEQFNVPEKTVLALLAHSGTRGK